jgi:hypothetical protein
MENRPRLGTPTGHPDGRGWLPLQPRRRTAFPLAVAMLIVLEGALLVVPRSGITQAHDHSVMRSEADDPQWSELVGSMMKMHDDMSAIERTGTARG